MIRVTIVVPEQNEYQANQLASCLGYTEEDSLTFSICPRYNGPDGKVYLVASLVAEEGFVQDAVSELKSPEWGADLEAAKSAQSMVLLKGEGEELSVSDLNEETILAILGDGVFEIRNLLELEEI